MGVSLSAKGICFYDISCVFGRVNEPYVWSVVLCDHCVRVYLWCKVSAWFIPFHLTQHFVDITPFSVFLLLLSSSINAYYRGHYRRTLIWSYQWPSFWLVWYWCFNDLNDGWWLLSVKIAFAFKHQVQCHNWTHWCSLCFENGNGGNGENVYQYTLSIFKIYF